MDSARTRALGLKVVIALALTLLVTGAVLHPRPPSNVSPRVLVSQALKANEESPRAPVKHIRQDLREGCIPVLEGADVVDGRDVWAVRLKIGPAESDSKPPKRYPWLELWIDKKDSRIIAWKEWGLRHGRVTTLGQYPKP